MEAVLALTAHNYEQLPKDKKYVLSFSCGKDSILLLETALKYGINPIIYHQYMIENLSYNKDVIDYIHENTKRVYPIYHWKDKEVWNYVYEHNLPVNKCYEMFGRSQDVINYQHLFPLKEHSPQDLESFIYKFPLIETLFWVKDENRKDKYFQFSENAKDGSIFNYNRNLDNYLILAFDDHKKKAFYSEVYFGEDDYVYLEGEYFGLKEDNPLIYKEPEKIKYTDSLKDASKRFEESKKDRNNADNFIILCFKDMAEKKAYCIKNNIPENVNAIDGMKYEVV